MVASPAKLGHTEVGGLAAAESEVVGGNIGHQEKNYNIDQCIGAIFSPSYEPNCQGLYWPRAMQWAGGPRRGRHPDGNAGSVGISWPDSPNG